MIKSIIAAVLAAAAALTASVGGTVPPPPPPAPCVGGTGGVLPDVMSAERRGVLVSRDGRLAVAGGPAVADPLGMGQGVVRHVATDPVHGTVFVRDLPGGDDIVAGSPTGEIRLHRRHEIFHPSWTPGGDLAWGEGAKVWFWSHSTGSVSSSSVPVRGGLVTAVVAPSDRRVVASIEEPVEGLPEEDAALSDLWRYDRRGGGWHRMTSFRATADRWSVIRTLQIGPSGLEFIRVHGRASSTTQPSFERWSVQRGRARLEATLPGERYLAGYRGAARLWDIPAADPTEWVLARETATGGLRPLGCGAVSVDPVDVPDPDRVAAPDRTAAPDRAAAPVEPGSTPAYPVPPPSPQPPAHEVAILVGDYAGEAGATNAAQAILDAYGADAQVKVVDSNAAPTALKPGSWAAILWIGGQADPVNAIQRFWDKLPQFADRSWVAAP